MTSDDEHDRDHAVPRRAEELLTSEPRVAFLGTCRDEHPHVAPLWYVYRAGVIEIATTGRKLANLRENPRVSLAVQKDDGGHPEWGVTIQGTATVVEDPEESEAILRRINRRYGAEDDAWSENTAVRVDVGHVEHWEY